METTQWPPAGWLTKPEAAKRLGISENRIAALGNGEPIKTTRAKNPASRTGQEVTLFHEGDVEAEIFRREHPDAHPLVMKALEPLGKLTTNLPPETIQRLMIGDTRLPEFQTPKPWITVDEAAEVSGLPRSIILQLIGERKLKCLNVGPRAGGSYRIRRVDLDGLEGEFLDSVWISP